jgi:uncharacterized protein (DUF2141 family)
MQDDFFLNLQTHLMTMKNIVLIWILFHTLSNLNGQINLTITIPNVRNDQGLIQIGVFDKKEDFPEEGKEFMLIIQPADAPVFVHTIENLAPGDYAIALMHDENADGVCNLNFLGIPKEGYGFSNNVKPVISAPSFDAAMIRVEESTTVNIRLIY